MLPPLTPALIMDLRTSAPTLRNLGGGVNLGAPYILYLPADDTFCLHAYGSPQAKHPDPRVLGAMMAGERAEPGFIRRVLDARTDCDTASLAPDDRAARERARAVESARQRAADAEREEARRRRANAIDVSRLDLEDL